MVFLYAWRRLRFLEESSCRKEVNAKEILSQDSIRRGLWLNEEDSFKICTVFYGCLF